jgi:hypothetical protein
MKNHYQRSKKLIDDLHSMEARSNYNHQLTARRSSVCSSTISSSSSNMTISTSTEFNTMEDDEARQTAYHLEVEQRRRKDILNSIVSFFTTMSISHRTINHPKFLSLVSALNRSPINIQSLNTDVN